MVRPRELPALGLAADKPSFVIEVAGGCLVTKLPSLQHSPSLLPHLPHLFCDLSPLPHTQNPLIQFIGLFLFHCQAIAELRKLYRTPQ